MPMTREQAIQEWKAMKQAQIDNAYWLDDPEHPTVRIDPSWDDSFLCTFVPVLDEHLSFSVTADEARQIVTVLQSLLKEIPNASDVQESVPVDEGHL
jgi:hypothetical protein